MLLFLIGIDKEDDRAFVKRLYYQYRDDMFLAAYYTLGNAADAEDAVQDVFLSVLQKHLSKAAGMDEERLSQYLLASAKNAALSILRKRRGSVSYEQLEKNGFEPACSDEQSYERLFDESDKRILIEAFKHIDRKYSAALYYRICEKKRINDIAELLGVSASTVKRRIERGKELLRQKYLELGGARNDD